MFGALGRLFGGGAVKSTTPARPGINARYENAQTVDENQRNWFAADYLSAKSANSFTVRRTLRMRSRYEVSNNPYLFGIVNSNADDLISTGPTLQVRTDKKEYNRRLERLWQEWSEEVALTEKLRTLKLAKSIDGEGFLVLKTAESLESPVKLYPCDVEADQFTSTMPVDLQTLWVDGLTLDRVTGRPESYSVLRHHPGDMFFPDMNPLKTDTISAQNVIHWFGKFRPGQVRGVPVFTSALDLFSELRAFRKAVLNNAQLAASYSAVITSQNPPVDDTADREYQDFQRVNIDRGMMPILPYGLDMKPFDSKQPQTTYQMFQEKCLGEACRPLNYPLNLALGTSQAFNFSSAKLDHINYRNGLTIERADGDAIALNPMFKQFYTEAVLSGAIEAYDGMRPPPHEWHWPGFEPLDPMVDADADHERLAHGTLTYREFWARRGYDWQDVIKQQSEEKKALTVLGLEFGDPVKRSITDTNTDDGGGKKRSYDPQRSHHGPSESARTRNRVAAHLRKIVATKDDNGQEHDAEGKFGTGGSSKGKKKDFHSDEHKEEHEAAETKHGEREARHSDRVDADEDDQAERRNDEDHATKQLRDKEDAKVAKTRAAEDAKTADARKGEDSERKAERTDEDKTFAESRAEEDADRKGEREAEDAEITERHATEKAELLDKHDGDEESEEYQSELVDLESEHDTEIGDLADARESEDDERTTERETEDETTSEAREAEDEERAEARETEDSDVAEARETEDSDLAEERGTEDSELDEARDDEDNERIEQQATAKDIREAAHKKKLADIAKKHAIKARNRMGVQAHA